MLPVTSSPLVASPPTAILTASTIAWWSPETRGLHCTLDACGVPDSSGQCAPACYSCNRSEGGSWTLYNPSPWVVGPQLTCCWGWGAWVMSGWRMEQRGAEQQSTLGLWWSSWMSSPEGGWY